EIAVVRPGIGPHQGSGIDLIAGARRVVTAPSAEVLDDPTGSCQIAQLPEDALCLVNVAAGVGVGAAEKPRLHGRQLGRREMLRIFLFPDCPFHASAMTAR